MAHSEVSEVLTIWGEESLDHSANETTAELETSSTGLTKQQIKNKKKRDAKKKKKQLHSQNMDKGNNNGNKVESDTKPTGSQSLDCGAKTEDLDNFEAELCWCIEQLELGLKSQKPGKEESQRVTKLIRLLKSEKTPKPKKRQVMRNTFGDYRKSMAADLRKSKDLIRPTVANADEDKQKGAVFVRHKAGTKSAIKTEETSDNEQDNKWHFVPSENSFTFNFPEPT